MNNLDLVVRQEMLAVVPIEFSKVLDYNQRYDCDIARSN